MDAPPGRSGLVMAAVLALGWAGLVVLLGAGWAARPPGRRPEPAAVPVRGSGIPSGRRAWAVVGLAAVVAALTVPVLVPLVLLAPSAARRLAGRAARRRRQADLVATVPEVVDLFAVAVAGGLPVAAALDVVAPRAPGPLGRALQRAAAQRALGRPVREALDGVRLALGEPEAEAHGLLRALQAADELGTPLGPALARLGIEARARRRHAAEEAARRLPVTMLFPLVCCSLPAFALLTVVPLVVGALHDLGG